MGRVVTEATVESLQDPRRLTGNPAHGGQHAYEMF